MPKFIPSLQKVIQKVIQLFALSSLILMGQSLSASVEGYSLAIRGNGHRAPAHWGALARLVEQKGLPVAMAGGSSASVTMFWLESIALNPEVKGQSLERQKIAASLLLKSLEGFFQQVMSRPDWQSFLALVQYLKQGDLSQALLPVDLATDLETLWQSQDLVGKHQFFVKNKQPLLRGLEVPLSVGLLSQQRVWYGQNLVRLIVLSSRADEVDRAMKEFEFFLRESQVAIKQVGQFDARSDHNLFFRPGILDFERLALSFGRVANFYAGYFFTVSERNQLAEFVAMCGPASQGLSWSELVARQPECERLFAELLNSYWKNFEYAMAEANHPIERIQEKVGQYIPAFPSTAVLAGVGAVAAKLGLQAYSDSLNPEFGRGFSVADKDIRFGYWGSKGDMQRLESTFLTNPLSLGGRDLSQDSRSSRFISLGQASWHQVFQTSPAEPGLSPLVPLVTAKGQTFVSAGGWSDLSPTIVLQGYLESQGLHDSIERVYLTRKGGESNFAQDVFLRLLGADPGAPGHDVEITRAWQALYSQQETSSFITSHHPAFVDKIILTNWNRFDPTQDGIGVLIEDGYRAAHITPCEWLLEGHSW